MAYDEKSPICRQQRALVIDDSIVVRKSLARALEKLGYSVSQAENGLEGLTHLKRELFDVILCDFVMPLMDGVDCVMSYREWEKENRPWFSAWIIGISGLTGTTDGSQCVAVGGMNDYKTKPMTIKDINAIRTNEQVLQRSRVIDELEASMKTLKASPDASTPASPNVAKEKRELSTGGSFLPLRSVVRDMAASKDSAANEDSCLEMACDQCELSLADDSSFPLFPTDNIAEQMSPDLILQLAVNVSPGEGSDDGSFCGF